MGTEKQTIFLSYSSKDGAIANEIEHRLKRKGVNVWRYSEQTLPGDLIPVKVSKALSESTIFCVIISEHSAQSRWVNAEISAAFNRWAREPHFKIIPIVITKEHLPSLLSGFDYLYFKPGNLIEISEKIYELLSRMAHPQTDHSLDWGALLDGIENDRFFEDPSSHKFGGWSKSYSINYLPLAFPDQVPTTVSPMDSITCTHWVVRGLFCMKRIITNTSQDITLLDRIEKLLTSARSYLLRHFDGKGAGVIRQTAEGQRIYIDVRHSATFAKAMLEFRNEPVKAIKKATEFSILNYHLSDGRITSHAEVYHLLGLVKSNPQLKSKKIDQSSTRNCQSDLENKILHMIKTIKIDNQSVKLVGESRQWHMSPYYSWWVLDAAGGALLKSDNKKIAKLTFEILKGLDSLKIKNPDDTIGLPISLEGSPDIGASAQIGEVLLRFSPKKYSQTINSIAKFLQSRITSQYLNQYVHHEFLWAIPHFFERYKNSLKTII
jgi:hypothetical protein